MVEIILAHSVAIRNTLFAVISSPRHQATRMCIIKSTKRCDLSHAGKLTSTLNNITILLGRSRRTVHSRNPTPVEIIVDDIAAVASHFANSNFTVI